jgi:biopolymer transport protein ExbB
MKWLITILLSSIILIPENSIAADSMQALLDEVKLTAEQSKRQHQKREKSFLARKDQQTTLLNNAKQKLIDLQNEKIALETTFKQQQQNIKSLNAELGSQNQTMQLLSDFVIQFSHDLNQSLSKSYSGFDNDYRQPLIEKESGLISINLIQAVWYALQADIVASQKITKKNQAVVQLDGKTTQTSVTTIGNWGALSNTGIIQLNTETHQLAQLPKSISDSYTSSIQSFLTSSSQYNSIPVDISHGQVFAHLLASPDLWQRIQQGGVIGYIILAIALIGVLIVIERYIVLTWTSYQTRRQLKNPELTANNPLGRVLNHWHKTDNKTPDSIEATLDEAILQELPSLAKRLSMLKVFYGIAPLLGLLGTITGMIETFQAITFFGNSDPQLMASGISQALITTALGLIVAIVFVWFHSDLNTKRQYIVQILETQSAGIVAKYYA